MSMFTVPTSVMLRSPFLSKFNRPAFGTFIRSLTYEKSQRENLREEVLRGKVGDWIGKLLVKLNRSINENIVNNKFSATAIDNGCLIDNPEQTMNNRLVDFQTNDVATGVKSALVIPPGPRSKPLLGILRGQGGGKTRALEELRRHLLFDENIVPIGITYNNKTPYTKDDWDVDKPRLYTVLSIIARLILSATSARDADDVAIVVESGNVFDEMITNLEELTAIAEPEVLLRGAVAYLVGLVREKRPSVRNCVILIDETVIHEKNVGVRFPRALDPFAVVREALLNVWVDNGLNMALVFSSLKPTAFGETESQREIRLIVLPERLNVTSVVKDWWKRDGEERDVRILELCAALINDIPRAVEIAGSIIAAEGDKPVNANFVQNLIICTRKAILRRYGEHLRSFPSTRILFAAFFNEATVVDRHFLRLVSHSVITNCFDEVPVSEGDDPTKLVPMLSIMLLRNEKGTTLRSRSRILANVDDLIGSIVEFSRISPSRAGALLEEMVLRCLELRWIVALAAAADGGCGVQPMTWARLLGIDEDAVYDLGGALKTTLNSPIDFASTAWLERINKSGQSDDIIAVHKMLTSSYRDSSTFLMELDSIQISAQRPATLIRSAERDAFDGGMKVFVHDSKPLYVFFECKSRRENIAITKQSIPRPNDWKQAKEMKIKCDGKIDFVYIYLSTHTVIDCVLNDNIVQLGKASTEKLMGPLKELYFIGRAAMID